MYKALIRPLLFTVDPEKIHHIVFRVLQFTGKIPGAKALLRLFYAYEHPSLQRKLFGITFKNPVGLAAGFDKDARLIDEMASLGFGSIEIGTLTPLAQPGNDKPRLFRLPHDGALINRMGFNNEGVETAVKRLKQRSSSVVVGGNIGKNKVTPNEQANDDYAKAFEALYEYVDYFVINVSSPNTPGLRALQEKEPLGKLMAYIKQLSDAKPQPKPVLLKIAPDLTPEQLHDIVDILKATRTDGIIATNTTISRDGLNTPKATLDQIGNGGLSGRPLTKRSTEVIRYLRTALGPTFPIIAVGGIFTAEDALEKIDAGADLIQLYTGFIYEGPGVVKRINKGLVKRSA
ncbi:quinone-dependent dihydroorotate dehydrogenase [Chryseolinea lacunae]|uniref:Dihydroorotate dehydrogenase (quinone) n=1 Tax=Chryseolinea lacunae TaxID=2801331 RepID=A0ABS1KNG9_9BACT|nr:quinone-dependent dihydroorotate dehydrogenase [Chryseolinea lacunae]MBL0740885.1 quinone-dependent dihydroorotate dehydrogenase [Chryseolinea lacunae]